MTRPRHRPRSSAASLALLVGVAFAACACSSSGGDAAPATTVAASSTTAGSAGDGPGPSTAELSAILPRAIDLGEGWVEAQPSDPDSADDPSPTDQALQEQCPELASLVRDEPSGDDDADVVRTFVDGDGREIEIELDPDARAFGDAELQEAVDATNACDQVELEDDDGVTTTLRFQAAVDPDHGEQAVKLQAEVTIQLPSEDEPISLTLYGLVFRTGSVGVNVTATDGIDSESLEVNRTDMELLTGLSDRLEASVDDLVG